MWNDDPDLGEGLEYVLGATAHLLAQMGDELASLLLEDVQGLGIESEDRGVTEEDGFGPVGSVWPRNSNVYYLDVEPYLRPRFTPEVMDRILPVIRSLAQRTHLPVVEFLDARLALPNIDTKNWRETLRQQYASPDVTNSARKERLAAESPVVDGLTFTNTAELAVYEALVRLQATTAEDRTFAISPLPGTRIRAGNVWVPDFLLAGNGRAMLIEVDGPHHAKGHRRADDDMRDAQWRRCGLQTRRVPVEYTRGELISELDAWLKVEVRDGLDFGR
ncbi:hypothetical protein EV649_5016 [Kribbella sp. VKM Ac-2569]|uniref:hypothetical protein n=1 Tax=Kribbella sp. VKM Ac-2569 TaxID=2512220 RepID=UPI00102BD370|nr:hypothetical protein [Kribbella sp. VKM Ac-2569]RZT17470.1 hypothetical protein EV649_5016 [Kribbella sp. VKM Ac-2569]